MRALRKGEDGMADRIVEDSVTEVPEIPETLEKVLLFALDEAKEKMESGEEVVPFTVLIVKDNLFIETHPGDSADECFALAAHTVEGARGADAYAFCYDGYVDTDAGTKDALIAEGGIPGEDEGVAICYLYEAEGDEPVFESEPAYVGPAPNFMADLKDPLDYDDDEIDEWYLEDEPEEAAEAEESENAEER